MPRRSNQNSGVRGPNSALTEFLRVEGITDAFRERRAREEVEEISGSSDDNGVNGTRSRTRSEEGGGEGGGEGEGGNEVGETTTRVSVDDDVRQIRLAARRKRRAAGGGDGGGSDSGDSGDSGDDNDYDPENDNDDFDLGHQYRRSGDRDKCVGCGKSFVLTVYSRFDDDKRGYLCEPCNLELKKQERNARNNQINARRKRKRVAQALLDKTSVRIPSLQDISIKTITQNIQQVEALGDIGQMNVNKISKILSKNRSLNNSTMTLFLNPNLSSIEFWDCSRVDSDSFNKIASFCPHLNSLTLFMCGQLHNDNLLYFNDKLTNLQHLRLNGPFLINDAVWQEFFETGGKNLETFEVRNTHRFTNDSLITLLECCGSKLTDLRLSRLDGIDSRDVYDLIPHYLTPSTLKHLELSYPYKEDLITDELLINILAITGESLTSLNVDGCSYLTDKFITEGICQFCPHLTHLSMKDLDQLTDEGVASGFNSYFKVNSGGLIHLDITKCIGLKDSALFEILKHSSNTLVELHINSINLSKDFLWQIFTDDLSPHKKIIKDLVQQQVTSNDEIDDNDKRCFYNKLSFPLLTLANLGFVRAVDDQVLSLMSSTCSKLQILEVFGNNKCTNRARTRNDLIIIGRQSDVI